MTPPVLSSAGIATACDSAISEYGADVLRRGGNAVDATLAMAALSWLVLPAHCGIGGDAFAVVYEPDGAVWTVNGSGYGPDGGTVDFYRGRGYQSLPTSGALSVAAPGGPAVFGTLHRHGASRELSELWDPVADLAAAGVTSSRTTRADIAEEVASLRRDPGLASMFLADGHLPEPGHVRRADDLSTTIRTLARDINSLYTGSLGSQAVDFLKSLGAPFTGAEWELARHVEPEDAVTGAYGGEVVHQTPLPTPGWMVLHQAALCDGHLASERLLSADSVLRLTGAAQEAFAHRLASCGSGNGEWAAYLEPAAVDAARKRLSGPRSEGPDARPFEVKAGDTTSTTAIDSSGRVVSFIQSLGFRFGSKVLLHGSGVVLNNRLGRCAYMIDDHPNSVAPRRKPLHTLNAWLVTDRTGGFLHAGNTPGGDGQVQWNMQLLSHLIDHGLQPDEAVAAPRFTIYPGSDANVIGDSPEIRCERRLGAPVLESLRAAGNHVVVQEAWGGGGNAQIICFDRARGVFVGASDPRGDGRAVAV